jgi:periplasmic protein TonB
VKRLFLAGAIALGIHALFLSSGSGWFPGKTLNPVHESPLSLTLVSVKPVPGPKATVREKVPKMRKGPVAAKIERKALPKPKPFPNPKPHPKNKPHHKSADHQKLVFRKAIAKPVPSPHSSVPMENHEAHKPEQAADAVPAPKKEISKTPSVNGFKEPMNDETVQDALSDYPDRVSAIPEQGQAAAETEPGPSGPAAQMAIPLYLENPRPKYPELARRRRFQGTVIVEVLVKKDGTAGDVKVSKSSGHRSLDRAALEAVKKWIFKPGSENGRVVNMRVKIPVRFHLN